MFGGIFKTVIIWSQLALPLSIAVWCPDRIAAQHERLELGQRLQRFEIAWELADEPSRKACVPFMQTAVRRFFSLQLTAAGADLDRAWQTVGGVTKPGQLQQYAIGTYLMVGNFCDDSLTTTIELRLARFYPATVQEPDPTQVKFRLLDSKKNTVAQWECSIEQGLAGVSWETGTLPEGDFQLLTEMVSGNEVFLLLPTVITRIADFAQRLQRLEQVANNNVVQPSSVRRTIGDSVNLLRSLQANEIYEIGFPAYRQLTWCEELAESEAPKGIVNKNAQQNDIWMSLAKGRKRVPVRLRAPKGAPGAVPVLILFHGAGGSENMFFETYGAGRVVREGLQRGWLVIAPRQGVLGLPLNIEEMLSCLEELFDIDRTQVILMGHSMGAGQVIRQASMFPAIPRAAVAIGGGSRAAQPDQLKSIQWYVAAGQHDFGKSGARQLHQTLVAAGVQSVYHEIPDVEHMVIVQAATENAFRFLDRVIAEANRPARTTEPESSP